MVDPIQARSSIPLPRQQTGEAARDHLPINSRKDVETVAAGGVQAKQETQRDQFEDYLNQSSVTTLEKVQAGRHFDPVDEITANSVYAQPGGKSAI